MNIRARASSALSAMFVGGQRTCCRLAPPIESSMLLNSAMRSSGPITWIHPPFTPASTRLISSKLSSPFSCSHREPEIGSKAMPKLLRMPYAKIFWTLAPACPPRAAPAAKNGLSDGVVPSSFRRRITPVRCASSGSGRRASDRRDPPPERRWHDTIGQSVLRRWGGSRRTGGRQRPEDLRVRHPQQLWHGLRPDLWFPVGAGERG